MKGYKFAIAFVLLAAPCLAAEQASTKPPDLTQQDVADIATALQIVGQHCDGNHVTACQAGADSNAVFAKVQAIYAAQKQAK